MVDYKLDNILNIVKSLTDFNITKFEHVCFFLSVQF